MQTPRLRWYPWAGAVILVTVLLVLVAGALFRLSPASVSAAPPWQDDYPVETFPAQPPGDNGYPAVTPTAFVNPTSGGPTSVGPTSTGPTRTAAATATLPPNVFLTENAELSDGIATPLATQTGGPTITPYTTATLTGVTPQPTRTALAEKSSGPKIDWGLFWIGFSLPVLSACGYVLYLLDRRPDLFRPR